MKIPLSLWPVLMPLLDQALAQPVEEREAWLCSLDAPDEVKAALRQLVDERRALEGGEFLAALPSMSADPAHESGVKQGLQAGDLIGAYRLVRELGQGGMSVVWLAERDDGQMRRQVALKMPHAGPGQALLAERLRRERDILASLEHRNIARLYDVGSTAQGLPFLVLEYIEGDTLPAHCEAHRLTVPQRLALFLQVLRAVQCAHTKLVLHRDLKPSNILVNRAGDVKLLDFGIAKLMQHGGETGATAPTELTQRSGQVLTPDYAAPEQIAGQPLTTASDVYALGVILFELLTSQRPYRLPRGTRGALEEAILATEPPPVSQVWQDPGAAALAQAFGTTPRRLQQALRGDLDLIVATALQKPPARRYATADAFARDLQHHLAHEPIQAQPDSRWYRFRKYAQRHAWALGAATAVIAALSIGLGLALWQAQQARQEAAKSHAITDFLVGLFENGDVEQSDALRKRQQTVEQLLVNSAQALGSQLKDQPQVRADLQGVVGGLLHNLAITDAAIQLRQERVAALDALGAPTDQRVQAWRDLANSQDSRGDTSGARHSLAQGLALCQASGMKPVAECQGLEIARGQMDVLARNVQAATTRIEPALKALRQHAPNTPQLADALVAMGDVLSQQGQADSSFALYEEAMAVRSKLWGPKSVRLAQERYQLAMSLWQVHRLVQADAELLAAWQTMSAALGPDHVNTALIELQLGRLRDIVRPGPDGRDHIAHASRVILSQPGSADPRWLFDAHLALGESALFDGRLGPAGEALAAAAKLHAPLAEQLPNDGLFQSVMAWYLDDVGRHEDARTLLLAERQRLQALFGAQHPFVDRLSDAVMSSYLAQNRLGEAEAVLKERNRPEGQALAQAGVESDRSSAIALLMAQGDFPKAQGLVEAQMASVQALPPGEQLLLTRYLAHEQMARLKVGLNQAAEAKPYFEKAIALLSQGNPHNPYLAMTRSRYGLCLIALGRTAEARQQMQLADAAFAAQPVVSPHFKQPLQALHRRL